VKTNSIKNDLSSDISPILLSQANISAFALKGTQLAFKCVWTDVIFCCSNLGDKFSVVEISAVTGYSKYAMYQKLKASIKRGYIEQTNTTKRLYSYKLTDKGYQVRAKFIQIYIERLRAYESLKGIKRSKLKGIINNL